MPLTWTPPKPPATSGYDVTIEPRVNRAEFGDGYSQRSPAGINALPRSVRLVFANLTQSQAALVRSFLQARRGTEAFHYAPPGVATGLWTATSWSTAPSLQGANRWNVTVTLTEEYDLA